MGSTEMKYKILVGDGTCQGNEKALVEYLNSRGHQARLNISGRSRPGESYNSWTEIEPLEELTDDEYYEFCNNKKQIYHEITRDF